MAATVLACSLIAFFFLVWLWSKISSWLQRHKRRAKELDERATALDEIKIALDDVEAAIKNLDDVLTKEREVKQRADEKALQDLDRRLAEKRVAAQHADEQAVLQRKIELNNLDKQLTEKRELEARMSEEYIYIILIRH